MSSGTRGHARRLGAAALLQACLCAVAAGSPSAEEPLPGAWLKRWVAEPPMAGNWFGARDALNDLGIKPSVRYWTDLMASVAGGQRRGQAYAGQFSVEIDADLGKLAGLRGLRFDVSGNWSSGSDLSADIGNTFTVAPVFRGTRAPPHQHVPAAVAAGATSRPQGGALLHRRRLPHLTHRRGLRERG